MSRDEADQISERSWIGPLVESDVARLSELLAQSSDAIEQIALLMAAGRGWALTLRSQVERFLSPVYDPMVVEEAMTTLCTWWSLEVEYRDFILAAIKGFPWDIDREIQGRGLMIAVDLLEKQPDREVLQAVLDVLNLTDEMDGEDIKSVPGTKNKALRSLSHIVNPRWRELPPMERIRIPKGAAADEVIARARQMLTELTKDAAEAPSRG